MQAKKAFTLIELLVVISILVLLMAILLPTLQRGRKQAKAVVCQANLRQWGVVFCMYMNEHDDRFDIRDTKQVQWWRMVRAYYADREDLLLCPMAARYETNKNDPQWELMMKAGWGVGSKFTPWRWFKDAGPSASDGAMPLYGSYGANAFALDTYSPEPTALHTLPRPAASAMPFLLDCVWFIGDACPFSEPPAYDGDLGPDSSGGAMKRFCIDRHHRAINNLFLDWSVRKMGLKGLWTIQWCGGWDTRGPWTKAGGVAAEDWPPWMRTFKDY